MNNIIIILVILILYNYIVSYVRLSNLGYEITDISIVSSEMILGDKPYYFFDFFKNLLMDTLVLYLATNHFNIDLSSMLFTSQKNTSIA